MSGNGYAFICGENSACEDVDSILSTKTVLLVNLSTNWPVRTHCEANTIDTKNDRAALFRSIASSYVFLFIFNEETTMNPFYLNQLGIAFARSIPIIGIRESSFILPNPLPEYYYSTEIIDLNETKPNDARNIVNVRGGRTLLSDLLIDCFRNAIVYSTDFHKHCLERLFRKVSEAYSKAKKDRAVAPSLSITDLGKTCFKDKESTIQQKIWQSNNSLTKCSKCGSQVKGGRRTSTLQKTNSVDNIFQGNTRSPGPRQYPDTPKLMITKGMVRPVMWQPSFSRSIFQTGSRRPATSVIRKTSSAKACSQATTVTKVEVTDQRPMSSNFTPRTVSHRQVPIETGKKNECKRPDVTETVTLKPNEVTEIEAVKIRRKSSTGLITNKRGALLRKMSSLPCIPTTYLVSEPGCDKPAFVQYPPVDTIDSDGIPEFTDDEDKETIHISRMPSPAISTCSTNIESE